MLVRVSAALMSFARTEDLLGRVGGDEFAWILPDTTREQAMVAVERARRLIAEAPADPQRITISAGISDTQSSTDASELLRLADSALYWSKAHGRNQSWIYDPTVVVELSERQRVEQLERAQALAGLRTLVQTRESRDLVTRDHSARVAEVAVKLAGQAGWPHDRALALGEAASLHDLGIVAAAAVPVASGPVLEPATIDRLRELAALSAQMAEGVLSAEQVTWIQGQYAASGATEDEVGGASLLALADAWDRMTAVAPGLPTQALVECERHTGVWFDRRAVEALRALLAAGELGDGRPFEDLEGTDQVEA
jgi:hypothetical protein